MNTLLLSIIGAILLAVFIFVVVILRKAQNREAFRVSLAMTLFLVRFPRYEVKEGEKRDVKQLISGASQLYSAFSHVRGENIIDRLLTKAPRIAFEIASPSDEEELGFYVAVAKKYEGSIQKVIHGLYPDSQVQKLDADYTIFGPENEIAASTLALEENPYLPIRTFQEFDSDPLGQLAESLSKVSHYKGAAIQLIITPVEKTWYARGKQLVKNLREGKPLNKSVFPSIDSLPSASSLLGSGEDKPNENKKEKVSLQIDNELIEGVSKKISRPAFYANIRLVASAPLLQEAQEILEQLEHAFSQFSLPKLNSFKIHQASRSQLKDVVYQFSFRNFQKKRSIVLNADELASVFHFPYPGFFTPGLKTVTSKESSIPIELPASGPLQLGQALYRGEVKDVYFASVDDRRRHSYIIGQTGTGKSYFMQELIRQDIEAGHGVGVIDPHGDLIEATLANIPKERFDDVVLFEPFEMERPQGLNMLEWETPDQKDFAVQEMITIFQKLFPPEVIGPMFEHYMRNAMLALMARQKNPGTLVEIPRIFTDDDFMENYLEEVTDPVVRSFWLREWRQTTGQSRSDMLGYVVSKVGRFIENEMMRNIIGQSRSGFDLGGVMNEQKIFLANLSKGKTGEVNSSLLGLILISKIQMAAMRRADMPQEQRKDFYLYVDEFQNFTTDSIATILSEARKYRLNLTMAHQYIAQLDEKIRDAAFGNVGTIASLRISQGDADIMAKQFEPEFSRFDLINLPNRQVIIKMLINGNVTNAFKMKTLDAKPGNFEQVAQLRKLSHLKYGREKSLVEKEIIQRSQLTA